MNAFDAGKIEKEKKRIFGKIEKEQSTCQSPPASAIKQLAGKYITHTRNPLQRIPY